MKEFNVIITETLRKVVTVEAETAEDAKDMVDAAWHNSEYILEAEDFAGVEFTVRNDKDGVENGHGYMIPVGKKNKTVAK